MKKVYKIEVDCANCANKMEALINKTEGVSEAVLNFLTGKLTVQFEENANIDAAMKSVLKSCRKIESDCEIYF